MTFTQLTTDFNRPGAGAEQWNQENMINIPTQGVSTQRLDAYWRFQWIDIQPSNASGPGLTMDFSAFDAQINDAISKGQGFTFGVMPNCCSGPTVGGAGLVYPLALHNAMQAESVKDWNNGGGWYENPNSPTWLAWFKALHVAINAHIQSTSFNGVAYKNVVKAIDIRIIGDFGEQAVLNNGPAGTAPTEASMINLIDAMVTAYPNIQLVAMVGGFNGDYPVGITPKNVGYHLLTASNNVGKFGWRRDNWGWTDDYNSFWTDRNPNVVNGLTFSTEIMNRYKLAPVCGEPADLGQAGHFQNLLPQVLQYHVSRFGNGNLNGEENNATTQSSFRAASKAAGYNLSITAQTATGTSGLGLSTTWVNTGVAPTYDTWNVVFQLRQGSTVKYSGTSTFKPRLFLPGTLTVSDSFTDAPAGTYDLYVIIQDVLGYRKPMPLAIAGQTADGSYLLQSSVVISGSAPPPPPPPPAEAANIFTTQTPTGGLLNDGQPLEIGVKFRSNVAGYITGVRFYKQSGNTGTHVGELYSSTGTRLAQATFTGETATGWQTVTFATPVAIAANTTYVAAYFSPSGFYSDTNRGLAAAITNSNLTALANGTDGSNGVYVYTNTPKFPTSTYALPNYWVDVVFTTTAPAPPPPPPPPPNVPPVSKITGPTDITLSKGVATLVGNASSDSDGTIASYKWTKVSGPTGDTIVSPTAATTVVNGLVNGTYVYSLVVTDNSGAQGSSSISINVHF